MLDKVDALRLSPQQTRLWLLQRDNPAYRCQCAVRIDGDLDAARLKEALQKIVRRHEILRTRFHRPSGIKLPFQLIDDGEPLSWQEVDLSSGTQPEVEARIDEIFRQEKRRGFDFASGAALRTCLLRSGESSHVLVVSLPALCADARTLKNLVAELAECYSDALPAEAPAEEAIQYADFADWQNELLESEEARPGLDYWRRHNFSAAASLALPFAGEPAAAAEFEPAHLDTTIEPALVAKIEEAARAYDTNAPVILLACWQTLLWRLTGSTEITVGFVCEGRVDEEQQKAFGLFSKWLPVTSSFDERQRFSEVVGQAHASVREAHEWQEFFTWRPDTQPAPRRGEEAFFSVGFEYEEGPGEFHSGGLRFSTRARHVCPERFKLKLACAATDGSLVAGFHYDSGLMTEEAVGTLAAQFTTLLRSAVNDPETTVAQLEVVGEVERSRLVFDFNDTRADYRRDECVHRLFERQAALTPEAAAIACEGRRLSYAELNVRANQLARYLRRIGVGPETTVALCLERSLDLIVGIIGVMKAGGAYAPLEVAQPAARLRSMLEDARVRVVVTRQGLAGGLPEIGARVLCLDAEEAEIEREEAGDAVSAASGANLAYVIFTSGSTGRPKGVGVEHRQLVNYVEAVRSRLGFEAGESYAVVSTFAADLGHTMTFPSLCFGGCLHVITQEQARDAGALADYFERHAIDNLKIVPSHLEALLSWPGSERALPRKRLVLGGEATRRDLLEKVSDSAPGCEVFNHYGPTETTVGVITHRLTGGLGEVPAAATPLGRPLPNTELYILDERQRLAPLGVVGELYVGGAGVSRGYLNRPALTAERFVPNPFGAEPGARLYRTGDLACYRPDGLMDFRGRADNQVKFHGFRVELDEIGHALEQHPQVSRGVVFVRPDRNGSAVMVAYYVSPQKIEPSALRKHLSKSIVEETLPNVYVHMKRLPLSLNGKIDYAALPTLEEIKDRSDENHVPPRTPTEQGVADICREILGVERLGVNDNFFELGGHSLLAIRAVARIRETFGVTLPLPVFFQKPTVAGLALAVTEMQLEEEDEGEFASMLAELGQLAGGESRETPGR